MGACDRRSFEFLSSAEEISPNLFAGKAWAVAMIDQQIAFLLTLGYSHRIPSHKDQR
jgi:hypothetical protein